MDFHFCGRFFFFCLVAFVKGDYITGSLQFESSDGSCLKWECLEETTSCAGLDNKVFNLDPTTCPVGQLCYVGMSLDGACIDNKNYSPRRVLYPGDTCSSSDSGSEWCAFGYQRCEEGYCRGKSPFQQCQRSGDCNFGYYCSENYCVPVREVGERCDSTDACGRTARCHFSDKNSMTGICRELFSLDDGITVALTDSDDIPIIEEGVELLCMSGWVDESTGRCATGYTSTNKGEKCSSDADCITNDEQQFAKCRCGANATGQKYCDLMGQDDEWKLARSKFREYYDKTQDCHPAARYTRCSEATLYHEWQCAHLNAKYFVKLIDNPPCVTLMNDQLDLWKMIQYHCSNGATSFRLSYFFLLTIFAAFFFQPSGSPFFFSDLNTVKNGIRPTSEDISVP